MKKQSLLILLTILSFTGYAQIKFESGYFIDNTGAKTLCLIKNKGWKDNPNQIEYKLADTTKILIGTIRNIQEFGVDNLKYIKATVDIDRSSQDLNQLSENKNPQFNEEELFLKLLIDGEAKLYMYEEGNLKRYFYNITNADIKQLVYKIYKVSTTKIDKNNHYRQQLWTNLSCESISENNVKKTSYNKSSLTKYFIKYNSCKDPNYENSQQREKRDLFNLSIKPGVNFSSVSIPSDFLGYDNTNDFGGKSNFRLGVEVEFVLPFNKNKWSVFVEPTFQNYQSDIQLTPKSIVQNPNPDPELASINYKSIELPIGLRYFMFISDTSKLFVNAAFVTDFAFDSDLYLERTNQAEELKPGTNVIGGLGFKYNDKYSIEGRLASGREISNAFEYTSFSLIFGYTLF